MTSDRKTASNRKNAQKSTGPRSELGRRHSSRNAFRHGLAIAIGSNPSDSKDIEALATTLERRSGVPNVGEFARQIAEAEIDLLRIRKLRALIFAPVNSNPKAQLADFSELDESLAKLERYDRRAFSRRKRALRAMTEVEVL
jgi:hypothetical protein